MPRDKNKHLENIKQWKDKNKYKVQGYASARRERTKEFIKSCKDKPCVDCEVKYPYYVMDFDHRENKKFNLGRAREHNIDKVKLEIEKCDVVCANCHRERTFKKGYYTSRYKKYEQSKIRKAMHNKKRA